MRGQGRGEEEGTGVDRWTCAGRRGEGRFEDEEVRMRMKEGTMGWNEFQDSGWIFM